MNSGRKHILIADSDEQALIALQRVLEDDGFDTTTAWNMSETMDLLEQKQFDLLLVADHPPEVNCEQVLRKTRGVPLVVLENKPRHPFSEPFLMTLGARRIVHKWRVKEVTEAVRGELAPAPEIKSRRGVAGAQ